MMNEEKNDQPKPAAEGGRDKENRMDTPDNGGAANTGDDDTTKIYFTGGSTLQTPEEYALDKNSSHADEESQVTASGESFSEADNTGLADSNEADAAENQ